MQQYKGSYYKGNNIGQRQFRQLGGKTLARITNTLNPKTKSQTFWIIFGILGFILLIGFFHFNRKESQGIKRDKVNDTIDLIQGVAKYNLENDLAKSQTTNSARQASINYRNPTNVQEILLEKQKAIAIETKRRNDYLAQQYALDYSQNDANLNINNQMREQSHDQFYQPPQPIDSTQYSTVGPIDKSRWEQTQIMYNTQFNNLNNNDDINRNGHLNKLNSMYYQEKPHYKINSPFIHPEETIRPLMPEPKPFNNTLEVGDKPGMFLENVPNNVFDNGYFQVQQSYESPFLADASEDPRRTFNQPVNKCLQNSNINNSGTTKVSGYGGMDSHPDYYYSGF